MTRAGSQSHAISAWSALATPPAVPLEAGFVMLHGTVILSSQLALSWVNEDLGM